MYLFMLLTNAFRQIIARDVVYNVYTNAKGGDNMNNSTISDYEDAKRIAEMLLELPQRTRERIEDTINGARLMNDATNNRAS